MFSAGRPFAIENNPGCELPPQVAERAASQAADEEEETLLLQDGMSLTQAPTDWRYVIKFTKKTGFSRAHKKNGCANAKDSRAGIRMLDIDDHSFDAYCRKCFKPTEAPLRTGAPADEAQDEASSSTSSDSSSTDFASDREGE